MVQLQRWLCLSIIFFSTRPAYPVSSTKQNLSNAVAPTISMAPTVPRYSDDRSSSGPEDQARPMPQSSSSSSSSWWGRKVLEAALITAVITLVIAGIIFFFCCRRLNNQRKNTLDNSLEEEAAVTSKGVRKVGKKVKGVIVNDNGRDIIYIKDSEGRKLKTSFSKHTPNRRYGNEKKRMDEALERPRRNKPREVLLRDQSVAIGPRTVKDPLLPITQTPPTPPRSPMRVIAPPSPPAPPIPPPPHPSPLPPPHTPPPPPPPPPLPPAPPLPPPSITEKRNSTQPPLPSRAGGLVAAPKPPPAPRGKPTTKSMAWSSGENLEETSVYNTKLKPLFWDKVNANTDHSVVWDLINDGSLRFEDDLIETLFYYTNAGLKPPQREGSSSRTSTSTSTSTAQVFVLEPRRSQNTAIVLKSLANSRKEILDAILEGHGLTTDILEKLVRISPTEEEKSKILQFTGNPTKLAVAESFLFYILKAVPSAFIRINAMLFRSNYYTEILQLKEYLQTLELGCKELRTHGLFLKLLEAILKAGNRMNAGTSRGNALGFHLTALRKLSDVKSTDGKTTLLHFVVEQVVRSEGKRCILNGEEPLDGKQRNRSLKSDTTAEERNKEYLLLGLPAVVKLSVEYANVKKAATVDHDNFINTCSSLSGRLAEIQQLVTSCGNGEEESAFVREMKGFLQESDEELRVMKEEQARVLELVRRTTDYYQVGSSKPKGACQLQLFIIVKDFLEMVDQACIDISKKLETKSIAASKGSSSQQPRPSSVRFPDFRLHLMSDMSGSTSFSDSDDEL